jgi:hypothetical protein
MSLWPNWREKVEAEDRAEAQECTVASLSFLSLVAPDDMQVMG